MGNKRVKKAVIAGISLAQFEEALSKYAGSDARKLEIEAKQEVEVNKIRSKYAEELSYLTQQMDTSLEVLQTYCTEQKEVLFVKRKTLKTVYGSLGFRLGTPKLKTLRGNTWAMVLERLKEKLPDYVRTSEEPAKDLLLADREKEGVAGNLRDIGLQVVQDETFFVEMKREAVTA